MLQVNLPIVNKIHPKSESLLQERKSRLQVNQNFIIALYVLVVSRICVKMEFTYGG